MPTRMIDSGIWDDPDVMDLPPLARNVFVFLLTTTQTDASGVARLHPSDIEHKTGIRIEDWEPLSRFIAAWPRERIILVKRFIKRQTCNPSFAHHAIRILNRHPEYVRAAWIEANADFMAEYGIAVEAGNVLSMGGRISEGAASGDPPATVSPRCRDGVDIVSSKKGKRGISPDTVSSGSDIIITNLNRDLNQGTSKNESKEGESEGGKKAGGSLKGSYAKTAEEEVERFRKSISASTADLSARFQQVDLPASEEAWLRWVRDNWLKTRKRGDPIDTIKNWIMVRGFFIAKGGNGKSAARPAIRSTAPARGWNLDEYQTGGKPPDAGSNDPH